MALVHRPAWRAPSIRLHRVGGGKLLLGAAIAALIVVALFQVRQLSNVTTTGYELNRLNNERAQKQAENHALEAEVAKLSSLGNVAWKARVNLHMVPAQHTLYIDVNQPVPANVSLPTRFLAEVRGTDASTPPANDNEPFWKRVLRLAPFF